MNCGGEQVFPCVLPMIGGGRGTGRWGKNVLQMRIRTGSIALASSDWLHGTVTSSHLFKKQRAAAKRDNK